MNFELWILDLNQGVPFGSVPVNVMFSLFNLRENYKFYIWVTIGAVVISIAFFWLQNILAGEEARVRKFILKGKRAVETKDILACSDMISLNYKDKYGNTRESIIYDAREVFAYYKDILTGIEKMDIQLNAAKDQATVEIVALVLCRTKEEKLENVFEGEKGRFRVKLIKEDKKWRLQEAEFLEELTIMGQKIT